MEAGDVGICNWFLKNCELLTPINADNSCKERIEKTFFGATLYFRLTIGF